MNSGRKTLTIPILLKVVVILLTAVDVTRVHAETVALEDVHVLPPEIPQLMSPQEDEIPEMFRLVEDATLMEVMGMIQNPGYITNRSETAALAERGALASFAGVYEDSEGVGLILNGIYFRDSDDFESFWTDQKEKNLRIIALEGKAPHGIWLVLIGFDPSRTYEEDVAERVFARLEGYRKRLSLKTLFNTFQPNPILE